MLPARRGRQRDVHAAILTLVLGQDRSDRGGLGLAARGPDGHELGADRGQTTTRIGLVEPD